ncbi:hypothetical protein TFLX_00235 [Thermoflexales bacterium]|nr:hypothetical protein TFLX_00235 [Thermoflexales bacterium]
MTVERFIPVVAIIGVALLFLLLGVVLMLRQRTKTPMAHEAVADDKPAPEWVKGLAGTAGKALTRTPATYVPADAILVRRDPVSGEWLVEVNGMQYFNLKDIHDDRAANKVLEALSGLQRFAGTIPIVKPELKAPPVESAAAPPAVPVAYIEPSVAQAMTKSSTPISTSLRPAPPNTILDQIEKILQHNLLRYPEFVDRRIHVGAAADGSMLIEVDRKFYQHADEVPDLIIRGVLKAAILEWERSA